MAASSKQHQDTNSIGAIGNHRSELWAVILFAIRLLGIFSFCIVMHRRFITPTICYRNLSTFANELTVFK